MSLFYKGTKFFFLFALLPACVVANEILFAGYWDSRLKSGERAKLQIIAFAKGPLDRLELYYQGIASGIYLLDDGLNGDFMPADGIFGFEALLDLSGISPMKMLLEIGANGKIHWPYLQVLPLLPTPSAIPTHTPAIPTFTPTSTPSITPTATSAPSFTSTSTPTPTFSPSPTISPTPSSTPTYTPIPTIPSPLPAFPGAEGEGKWASGGRGGDVYHVTNLNDSGAGSFRYGIQSATGPRYIVFDIGGLISLSSPLNINKSNLTIAGQTAPGDGICFKDGEISIDANNIIIRHIRVRLGDNCGGAYDSINIGNARNVILDHCSFSFSIDETCSVVRQADKITIQWCIISLSLNDSIHPKGPHGYASLFRPDAACNLSVHHNIYAHHAGRSPRPGSYNGATLRLDFRNNIIYNWGGEHAGYGCYAEDNEKINMNYIGNYLIAGANSTGAIAFEGNSASHCDIYQSGNLMDANKNGRRDGRDTGWNMFSGEYDDKNTPFSFESVTTHSAQEAYFLVLAQAGATKPARDPLDAQVVSDIRNETGTIIDDQDQIGGWPNYSSGTPRVDSDGDGMPDTWEILNGTNKDLPDHNGDVNYNGYTNLEDYLNSLCN